MYTGPGEAHNVLLVPSHFASSCGRPKIQIGGKWSNDGSENGHFYIVVTKGTNCVQVRSLFREIL